MNAISICSILLLVAISVNGFTMRSVAVKSRVPSSSMRMNMDAMSTPFMPMSTLFTNTLQLADTSITEEEVLAVTGVSQDLPDPIYIIVLAGVVLLGIGILQFSLGDLTKEEGQARVRDYLETRRDTERKRGYFD